MKDQNRTLIFLALNRFLTRWPYFITDVTIPPALSFNSMDSLFHLSPSHQILINENILDLANNDQEKITLLLYGIIKLNWHFILEHVKRGKDKHPIVWQLACNLSLYNLIKNDMEFTNSFEEDVKLVNKFGFALIKPSLLNLPDNLSAEEYYSLLMNEISKMSNSSNKSSSSSKKNKNNNNNNDSQNNQNDNDIDQQPGNTSNQNQDLDQDCTDSQQNSSNQSNQPGSNSSSSSSSSSTNSNQSPNQNNNSNDMSANNSVNHNFNNNISEKSLFEHIRNLSKNKNKQQSQNQDDNDILKDLTDIVKSYNVKVNNRSVLVSRHLALHNPNIKTCMDQEFCKLNFYNYLKKTNALKPGNIPGELSEFVSKLEIRRQLPKLFDTFSAFRPSIEKRSFEKMKKRRINSNVIIAGRKYRGSRTAVIVDSSGSMTTDQLRCALGIINLRVGIDEVFVYVVDTEVHQKFRVMHRLDELEIKGRGGTDIVPAFEEALKDRPDKILIISDGEVQRWPKSVPIPVIFCYVPCPGINQNYIEDMLKTTPDWMHKCVFDDHLKNPLE